MGAVVLTAPHAFEIREVPRPEPGANEVLCPGAGDRDLRPSRLLAIAAASRGGRVVLGGATGQGVELPPIDPSTIIRHRVRSTWLISPPTTSPSTSSPTHRRRSPSAAMA